MKADDTFPFDLSLDELHWLAGAFGIASLPLPDHPQLDLSRAELVERQKKGHASLLHRGLIQSSPGFGWQVDRLPAALVQWMETANSMLRVERIEKRGAGNPLHIFASGEQALSVEIKDDNAQFTLYKSRAALMKSLKKWLNIPIKDQKSKETFSIPQPQVFLPVTWKDPQLAAQILAHNGLSANSKTLIEWAASLKCLFTFSKMQINSEAGGASAQFILCIDGKSLWGVGVDNQETDSHFAMFSTTTLKEFDAKIDKMV